METEKKFTTTPEERVAHEEVLRRQRILQGLEGNKARQQLEGDLKNLTPEEQAEIARLWEKKDREHEEGSKN